MATIRTVVADEWGEVAHVTLEGHADVERGIRYRFEPARHGQHTVLVAAEDSAQIVAASINGRSLEAVSMERGNTLMFLLNEGEAADVEVRVRLRGDSMRADVHMGFFRRIGERAKGWMKNAIGKLDERCIACKALARSAITFATGGADLVGEGVDRALEGLAEVLDDYIADTILKEIIDAVRGLANPGRYAAAEICKSLGYCK